MKAHLESASEEHLSKTWFKLLKTTQRLSKLEEVEVQIGELQADKESMKRLLDKTGEEMCDLKLSEKKLEVENMALKKELEDVKRAAANDREEISSLKRLVLSIQTKVDALDEKQPESRTSQNAKWSFHEVVIEEPMWKDRVNDSSEKERPPTVSNLKAGKKPVRGYRYVYWNFSANNIFCDARRARAF